MDSNPARSTEPRVVSVELGERSYPIHIVTGATGRFAAALRQAAQDITHALVICDQAVRPWTDALVDQLRDADTRVDVIGVPSGEPSKSVKQFEALLDWMLQHGADRRSVVVAVGGGVIGDLAGYAAASFARGVRFAQVPTTLLAMVDSSVGGKTGINLAGAKNMVGAFWQPQMVWIDTLAMKTLPDRSYLSGLAEIVKYGVIDDDEFFAWLESNAEALVARQPSVLQHAIEQSCLSKARVVGEDERETSGRRAILNYGHTFAHAIEATAGYGTLLHGEAVAIGMQMAASLAIDLGMCTQHVLDRQTALLQCCQLPIRFADADPDRMLPVMLRDKKVVHGKLRFILPTRIGHVDLVGGVESKRVEQAILSHR